MSIDKETGLRHKILRKLSYAIVNFRFLNRWLVLLMDLVLATGAALLAFVIVAYLIDQYHFVQIGVRAAILSLFTSLLAFLLTGTYKGILRYTTSQEVWKLCYAIIVKMAIEIPLILLFRRHLGFGPETSNAKILLIEFLNLGTTLSFLAFSRAFLVALFRYSSNMQHLEISNILVYGTGDSSISCIQYLENIHNASYIVVGLIQFSDKIRYHNIAGKKVFYIKDLEYLEKIIDKKDVRAIVFPSQISAVNQKDNLVPFALKRGIKIFAVPDTSEIEGGSSITAPLKEIRIEDLLGRDEVEIDETAVSGFLKGKRVLVTGAAGSIGSELCRLISGFDIERLVMLDNAETPMHNLTLELNGGTEDSDRFEFFICDVRNKVRLERAFNLWHPQIIFHAAAYKHVPMMELNPTEAVRVNVLGTKNIAQLAVQYGVEKMIMVSTDKAVNPTNVMGASKRIAEIYTQSLSRAIIDGEVKGTTKFITTRFGNVLGSNGSVIPRFKEQIASGGPVTVTHKDIVRYFMSIPEACRLVLEAATLGQGYEIFVFDMGKPVKISDLAENMIRLAGYTPGVDIKIEYTGLRPGEKLYEELLNTKENTLPTANKKIFIAKVREFPYAEVDKDVDELIDMASRVDIISTVRKMKKMVPEYKSRNSVFEQLDKMIMEASSGGCPQPTE
ncbi:MAG: polysaccharide biosynthesis protein [Bacteroidales bacterium]|nr:polysaccharide biosynthesis protein [Bacteroidales bacterium]MBR6466410.1 polysaccharide biosynthesis protein [Bacteroidales bacterium]